MITKPEALHATKVLDGRMRTVHPTAPADTHGDIPPFLEIEAPSKERVAAVVTLLGFTPDRLRA